MQNSKAAVASALAAVMTLALVPDVNAAPKKADGEKCYGVVKAAKNDCKTLTSACAGHSTEDSQKDAFLVLPKGVCERLVGGTLDEPKADAR